MTGAIVVGDGEGAGNGETVAVRPLVAAEPESLVRTVEVRTSSPIGWIAGGAIGLALGAGLGLLARRRRAQP